MEMNVNMICEKCWSNAYFKSLFLGKSQAEIYQELLLERKDNPCTPQQQAGDYWDEENQCDSRNK
jgi:hypothetical protein